MYCLFVSITLPKRCNVWPQRQHAVPSLRVRDLRVSSASHGASLPATITCSTLSQRRKCRQLSVPCVYLSTCHGISWISCCISAPHAAATSTIGSASVRVGNKVCNISRALCMVVCMSCISKAISWMSSLAG